jgi:DNA modification methylase
MGGESGPTIEVITGDATRFAQYVRQYQMPLIDYVLTSPPYWNMLHARGAATQRNRRAAQDLDVVYSGDPADLGNIAEFDQFLDRLVEIYAGLKPFLRAKAYLTIIVKNVKKGGRIYPLAWELARILGTVYALKDERIWCQDDIRLAPYGLGNAWVSNTFHHYCLQFRNE